MRVSSARNRWLMSAPSSSARAALLQRVGARHVLRLEPAQCVLKQAVGSELTPPPVPPALLDVTESGKIYVTRVGTERPRWDQTERPSR